MNKKGPIDELLDIKDEFMEGPKAIMNLGWNAVFPLMALFGLICLVAWALL